MSQFFNPYHFVPVEPPLKGAQPPVSRCDFKRCLIEGLDELGALLADIPAIQAWEVACGR